MGRENRRVLHLERNGSFINEPLYLVTHFLPAILVGSAGIIKKKKKKKERETFVRVFDELAT